MKLYLAGDHAGFELKQQLATFLTAHGHEVVDLGPSSLDPQDDYPDFVTPLAQKIAQEPEARGIIVAGSGEGEAMCANRVKGVRAAVYYGGNSALVQVTREHNDANVLSIGARFVSAEETQQAVELFLATAFSGEERHVRRLAKF